MIRQIIITSAIIAVSHNVYATGLTVETVKANLDKQSYLVNNGKERISLEHIVNKDGTIETKVKRSYLPAVTDGKIIDKTRSYKLALNAKKFGKYLGKGVGYATFAQMAIDLLGSGVDYVLDPKNNSVQIYKHKYDYCYAYGYSADNPLAVARAHCGSNATYDFDSTSSSNVTRYDVFRASCEPVNTIICSVTISEREKDKKVMTDEEFAKEVLKAAAASQNNDKAKKVVIDYAKQEILDGDHDDTINEIVSDINSDTDTQPNPTNPTDTTDNKDTDNNPNSNPQTNPKTDKPKPKDEGGGFELPPFCSWATHVCKFIDWFREDPALGELDKIDIPVQDRNDLAQQDINKQYYNAVGQCPAPAVVNTNFGQIKIPYDTLCSFFSRHSPILIAIAYLIGGYIVIGRR